VSFGFRRRLVAGAIVLATALLTTSTLGAAPPTPPETALGEPVTIGFEGTQPNFLGCGGDVVAAVNDAWEQEVVELVNAFRVENMLPPLKRVQPLDNAARYHSADMAQDNYFAHDSYDRSGGELTKVCAWNGRIASYYTNMYTGGENIAAGYPSPVAVVDGWKSSSGHRANMLNASFWEIGVGYYYQAASQYGEYWTQDFGRRVGVYPLIINNEAATTNNRSVTVYIYGNWSEIRLRNDGGSWSRWQPFSNRMSWSLRNLAGERTVQAELRRGSTTATTADTIFLEIESAGLCPDLPDLVLPRGVGLEDLAALELQWQQPAQPPADCDDDARITIADITCAAVLLGSTCP
jgi:uncharacterized protein YkwD